jgi:type III pantothenate kinase
MKILVFDAGNTALKWRVGRLPEAAAAATGGVAEMPAFESGGLVQARALRAELRAEFSAELARALASLPSSIDAAYGCSVASREVMDRVDAETQRRFGLPVLWLDSQAAFAYRGLRLRNGYRDPARLGADRWHALIAARAAWPDAPVLVINAGTATTVDCLRADGLFTGGVIAPGVQLMFDALARGTARLPQAAGAVCAHPDNTGDAITTGVWDCQIGLIERRLAAFAERSPQGPPIRVLIDGGHGPALRERLHLDAARAIVTAARDLVPRGVALRAAALQER